MRLAQLFESSKTDALDLQQFLIDEGYETELKASKWVMRNHYTSGKSINNGQIVDIEGGVLLLVKKDGVDNHWTSAYHLPDDELMGVAMFVDDPGNHHKHVPGHPNLAFDSTYKTLDKVKRFGLPV